MVTQSPRKKSAARPRSASANESGERESVGFRAALPALDVPTQPAVDPELENRIFALVTAVEREEGMTYPPEWSAVVYAAKARGYVIETGLKLALSAHGKQWLAARAHPTKGKEYTMTKIDPSTRLALKDMAHEVKVPMQEVIGLIIEAVHRDRDALTRIARSQGLTYPWEAIHYLVKGR